MNMKSNQLARQPKYEDVNLTQQTRRLSIVYYAVTVGTNICAVYTYRQLKLKVNNLIE